MVHDPLQHLETLLPAAKARYASLRIHRGELLDFSEFARRGFGLSKREADDLTQWNTAGLSLTLQESVASSDGTERLILKTSDGELVETVAMSRGTVCVSSQIGCGVGCVFCASGLRGLKRNLKAHEIVEQVIWARRRRAIRRVVYMGMGEPSHNLEAVLEAVTRIRDWAGIGAARQMVSTVGSVAAITSMKSATVRPGLALSLHAADDQLRRRLVPRASGDSIVELVAAVEDYARDTGNPAQFEWTLLRGINDSDEELARAADLLRGTFSCLNLIVVNPVDGLNFESPEEPVIRAKVQLLRSLGIYTTVRHSDGPDADAACGQLRRRRSSSPEPLTLFSEQGPEPVPRDQDEPG